MKEVSSTESHSFVAKSRHCRVVGFGHRIPTLCFMPLYAFYATLHLRVPNTAGQVGSVTGFFFVTSA